MRFVFNGYTISGNFSDSDVKTFLFRPEIVHCVAVFFATRHFQRFRPHARLQALQQSNANAEIGFRFVRRKACVKKRYMSTMRSPQELDQPA
jgi:hypothetical protein